MNTTNGLNSIDNINNDVDNLANCVTPLQRLLTTSTHTMFSHRFTQLILDPYDFSKLTTGNGYASVNTTNTNLEVGCTIGASSSSTLITKSKLHYFPSKTGEFLFTMALYDNINNNSICKFGAFSDSDGVFFEYSGGNVYIVHRNSSSGSLVDTKIIRSSWNNPANVLDFSKQNVFRIRFLWFGHFFIEISAVINNVLSVLHTFYFNNTLTAPYWKIPIFGIRAECSTLDNLTSQKIISSCVCANIYGEITKPIRSFQYTVSSTITTTETPISIYRLKSTFKNGFTRLINVHFFNTSAVNNQFVTIFIYLLNGDATYTTNGSYTSFSNSITEYNNTLTTFSGGSPVLIERHYINTSSSANRMSSDIEPLFSDVRYNLNNVSDAILITAISNTGSCTLATDITYYDYY